MPPQRSAAAAALTLAFLAGCSRGDAASPSRAESTPAPPTSSAPVVADTALPPAVQDMVECPDEHDRAFRLRAAGRHLTGYLRGSGRRVVALTHQSRGTPCDLAGLSHRLADDGYRVVAWTGDPGPDARGLATLVAHERRLGARAVALVGASLGAATSITAAARITPPVDAVVSLSSASQSERTGDVLRAVARYRGPLMAVAGEQDPSFASLVPQLAEAHPGPEQVAVVPGTSDHGKDFVRRADSPMADQVVAFLRANLPS